jgi:hypothetical protein
VQAGDGTGGAEQGVDPAHVDRGLPAFARDLDDDVDLAGLVVDDGEAHPRVVHPRGDLEVGA